MKTTKTTELSVGQPTASMPNIVRRVKVVMAAEALPSFNMVSGQLLSDLAPNSKTTQARLERSFHKLIEANMRTTCGNDFALDCVGLSFNNKVTAPSSYKGHVGVVEQFDISTILDDKAIFAAAAIKGYVQDQEAVTIRSLVPSRIGRNDVWSFDCRRVITHIEMADIRLMLSRYGIDPNEDVALVTSKDGIDILNISGMSQSMFSKIPDILSKRLKGTFYACNNNFANEKYDYGYIGEDSLKDAQDKYLKIIEEFNRSNGQFKVCFDLLEQKRKENRAIANRFINQYSRSRTSVERLSAQLAA